MKKSIQSTKKVARGKKVIVGALAATMILGVGITSAFAATDDKSENLTNKNEVAIAANCETDGIKEYVDGLVKKGALTADEGTKLVEIESQVDAIFEEIANETDETKANDLFDRVGKLMGDNEALYKKADMSLDCEKSAVDMQNDIAEFVKNGTLTADEGTKLAAVEDQVNAIFEKIANEKDDAKMEELFKSAEKLMLDHSELYAKISVVCAY